MSSVLRSFLHTQPIKPLTVARYIDDIFIIWTDTIDNLRVFQQIPPQPSIHTWINFLDLTIFKGPHFQYTNILDFRTFQSLSIPTLHVLSPNQLSEVNVYATLELTQLENSTMQRCTCSNKDCANEATLQYLSTVRSKQPTEIPTSLPKASTHLCATTFQMLATTTLQNSPQPTTYYSL